MAGGTGKSTTSASGAGSGSSAWEGGITSAQSPGEDPLLEKLQAQNLVRLKQIFAPGAWVLALGCGAGEEALALASQGCMVWGIDDSPPLIAAAEATAKRLGLTERAHFRHLALDRVHELQEEIPPERLTGAWSSLGAINRLEDFGALRDGLAHLLKPSGRLVLQALNDRSAFERLYAITHAAFPMLSRRKQPAEGSEGLPPAISSSQRIWFREPQALANAFKPHFSVDKVVAINPLQPSLFLRDRYLRHAALYDQLGKLTSAIAESPSVVRSSDLYWLMMFRETLELGGRPHGPHWLANG